MTENWKDIEVYDGDYQVSNFGRVKSLKFGKERILKLNVDDKGYYSVKFSKDNKLKTYKVHWLVGHTFFYVPKGYVIDHIDNTQRLNNRLDNLQVISFRENLSKDQWRHNRSSKYVGVCWHKGAKKWNAQIQINGKKKHLGSFDNEEEAHEAYKKELESWGT